MSSSVPNAKLDSQVPLFCGSRANITNFCGSCGTDATSHVWRRGWPVSGKPNAHVNLCNACGLAFRSDKYKNARKQQKGRRQKVNNASAGKTEGQSSNGSVECRQDKRKGKMASQVGKYVSYTIVKKPILNRPKRSVVLFYVQDKEGVSRLAVVGTDVGSSHFVYRSEELGHGLDELKCTNRIDVQDWLKKLGADTLVDPEGLDLPEFDESRQMLPDESPKKKRKAKVGHEVDGDRNNGSAGKKRKKVESAVTASGRSGAGKGAKRRQASEKTPPRGQRRLGTAAENNNEAEGDSSEVESLGLWIQKEAQPEEVEKFRGWADKLESTILYDCDTKDPECTTRKKTLQILKEVERHPICLSLLEASSLPKRVARLSRHENKRISELARKVKTCWLKTAKDALSIVKKG